VIGYVAPASERPREDWLKLWLERVERPEESEGRGEKDVTWPPSWRVSVVA
tara:strand:+ start:117 stop:269 length:153 start_codon:yes stop_codon:yes gene_type:complete